MNTFTKIIFCFSFFRTHQSRYTSREAVHWLNAQREVLVIRSSNLVSDVTPRPLTERSRTSHPPLPPAYTHAGFQAGAVPGFP